MFQSLGTLTRWCGLAIMVCLLVEYYINTKALPIAALLFIAGWLVEKAAILKINKVKNQ